MNNSKHLLLRKSIDFSRKVDELRKEFTRNGLYYCLNDICKMVAAMPAPRFYINAETASRQYNRYKRGVSNIHEVEKRKMYADVFARYENKIRLLKESGQKCSKLDIWESILLQEAPSFYYSGMSSVVAYYKALALIKKYKITV